MDAQKLKELHSLQHLLDNCDKKTGTCGDFHYDKYYDRGNYRIQRGYKGSQAGRESFLMPENPEHSEIDWWIMLTLSYLKLADGDSIARYLYAVKKLHPDLLFQVDDPKFVKRRLNYLTRLGFVMTFAYMANTCVELNEAEELWKTRKRALEDERVRLRATDEARDINDFLAYDGEEDDFFEGNEVKYADYNNHEYTAHIEEMHKQDLRTALGVLEENSVRKEFFGKNAKLIKLYALEDTTYRAVKTRFGTTLAAGYTNPIMRFVSDNMGQAAVGFLAGTQAMQKSFREIKNGKIYSKINGNYYVPAEMSFAVDKGNGVKQMYDCGMFFAFNYKSEGKMLLGQVKSKLMETIYVIKNYIGIKADLKGMHPQKDAFVIIVVDNTIDLLRFMEMLMKKVSIAESNRIFFTGEGIIRSDVGLKKMIGMRLDETQETGYSLYPVTLPIVDQ